MSDFYSVAVDYCLLARRMDPIEAQLVEIQKEVDRRFQQLAAIGLGVRHDRLNLDEPVGIVNSARAMWKYRLVGSLSEGPKISDAETAVLSGAGTEVEAPFDVDTVWFDVERYEVNPTPSLLKMHGLWGHHMLTKEDRIPGELGLPFLQRHALHGRLERLVFRSSRFF